MSFSPFPGPVAPENNPPINPQYFQPSDFTISNITLGVTTTVTTSVNHNYVVGQLVRLHIPDQYRSVQLNESQGYVLSIPSANQVVINIDSSYGVNTFQPNPAYGPTVPQICAIGDINSGILNVSSRNNGSNTNVPGAFINISPL